MELQVYSSFSMGANMYVLSSGKDIILIDPCVSPAKLSGSDFSVKAILITHGHFDHITDADAYVEKFGCPVYISSGDKDMLSDPRKNHAASFGMDLSVNTTPVVFTKDIYSHTDFGIDEPFRLEIIKTPGHTSGSVCFLFTFPDMPEKKWMFTGDTLFQLSIGRTDLGGSDRDMRESLKLLSKMEDDIDCFPGHGERTTIGFEKKKNPYMAR